MGMFDYIQCEVPLPDGWEPNDLLQTKDFNCDLVTHIITKDGRLMLEQIDAVHEVPKEERPYPNDKGWLGLCGSIRSEKSIHKSNFHGIITFYGCEYQWSDGSPAHPNGVCHGPDGVTELKSGKPLKHIWHEYNAKFTDGQLVEITQVKDG